MGGGLVSMRVSHADRRGANAGSRSCQLLGIFLTVTGDEQTSRETEQGAL